MWNPGDPIPHQHPGSVEACFCDSDDRLICADCGHYHIVGDDDGADGGCGTCECFNWSEPKAALRTALGED